MKSIFTAEEVAEMIEQGRKLILAGDEKVLDKLPKGDWIAGTIPYFMGDKGGFFSKTKIHVTDITKHTVSHKLQFYSIDEIDKITTDSYKNGFIFVVLPALQPVHYEFGMKAPYLKNLFINPLLGWVAGVKFEEVGKIAPKVYINGEKKDQHAAVMHVEIPSNKVARVEIINVYTQGTGEEIIFPENGFDGTYCIINGKKTKFADYLQENNYKDNLPLVSNYAGALVNVGFRWHNKNGKIDLYAPVFKNTIYKMADNVTNYAAEFRKKLDPHVDIDFSCNCLMNYFNFKLPGEKIPGVTGPITYGEIAYQLLNQTFVYLVIEDRY